MTPSDRASVREATLREAANTCLSHNGCQRWGGLSCYSECHRADSQAILALIHHPAPDPPSDALTADQIRDAIWPPVDSRKPLAWSAEDAVKRVLALLAAPRTEKPK